MPVHPVRIRKVRNRGETQSKEQTGTLSASQRLCGQIAPIAASRVAVTQELYDAIANGNFYLAVPSWCSVVPGWGRYRVCVGTRVAESGMPGLHLRTDHLFRLGGSLAFPRGGFVVLECGG